jgi:hypothetical protein
MKVSMHKDVGHAVGRAPLECAVTVALAACMSYGIETGSISDELTHVFVAGLLITLLSWSATLAHATHAVAHATHSVAHATHAVSDRTRMWLNLAAGAAGVAYFVLTPDMSHGSDAWRALTLCVAATAVALAVPGFTVSADQGNSALRRIDSRVLLRTMGIGLYGLALFAGLAVALAAVDNLFELHLHRELYGHVFIWIMIVLVPWVVFGGVDDYVRPADDGSTVARVVFKLARYLFPPLVAIYFLILCAYVVRIAITHELPRNLVSPMVIAAGVLSALACIVFDPQNENSAGLRWIRFTPVLFAVVAPLGWWAVLIRYNDYGWTEFRLLRLAVLVILSLLAIGGIGQLVARRNFSFRAAPALLAIILAIVSVGPWSVQSIARRSQQQRLREGLKRAGIDVTRPIAASDTAPRAVPGSVFQQVQGAATYLEYHYGREAVSDVVPGVTTAVDVVALYHLAATGPLQAEREYVYASLPFNTAIPVPGGTVYRVDAGSGGAPRQPGANRATGVNSASNQWTTEDALDVVVGRDTLTAAFGPVVSAVTREQHGVGRLPITGAAVTMRTTIGQDRGYLTIIDLSAQEQKGHLVILHVSGILTLKGQTP